MLDPKIEFRYSWIYNQKIKRYLTSIAKHDEVLRRGLQDYPKEGSILKAVKKYEKEWNKHDKAVLAEISRVSGLKWRQKKIIVYVVGRIIPFSDPLTLPVYKSRVKFVDNLTHELLHQIQSQNWEGVLNFYKFVNRKYKNESVTTKNHIIVHAIHKYLYLKFFGVKRLNLDIKSCSSRVDYKRSWDIVQSEGYENLIKDFRSRVKKNQVDLNS
ncbi:MAG: hypothetical protein M1594_02790 [Candidatus Marsarchaeota archaeon]|nr:hypothetical protein [Candidatus Marsarchaeota archaeon]